MYARNKTAEIAFLNLPFGVEFCFFPILIEKHTRALGYIARGDCLRGNSPGAPDGRSHTPQAAEIELATNRRLGATSVRHVVRIKRHHMGENVIRPYKLFIVPL